jgi:general stress protein CsbA
VTESAPTPESAPDDHASRADAVLPVAIGTALWATALIVLVVLRARLEESGATWWIGVAVVGLITGLLATAFLVRRRRRVS